MRSRRTGGIRSSVRPARRLIAALGPAGTEILEELRERLLSRAEEDRVDGVLALPRPAAR